MSRSFSSYANMTAATGIAQGEIVCLDGYRQAGDGGQGRFIRNSASSATVDGGMVAPSADGGRLERLLDEPGVFHMDAFGAKGDDPAFDNRPVMSSIAAAITARGGGVMRLGDKVYWHGPSASGNVSGASACKFTSGQNVVVEGTGLRSMLKYNTANSFVGCHLLFEQVDDIRVEKLKLDSSWTQLTGATASNNALVAEANSRKLTVRDVEIRQNNNCAIHDPTWGFNIKTQTDSKLAETILDGVRFYRCKNLYLGKDKGGRNINISNIHAEECSGAIKIDGEQSGNVTKPPYPTMTGQVNMTNLTFKDHAAHFVWDGGACIDIQEYVSDVNVSNVTVDGCGQTTGGGECPIQVLTGQTSQDVKNLKFRNITIKNSVGGYPVWIAAQTGSVGGSPVNTAVNIKNIEFDGVLIENSERAGFRIEVPDIAGTALENITLRNIDLINVGTVGDQTSAYYRQPIVVRMNSTTNGSVKDLVFENVRVNNTSMTSQGTPFVFRFEGAAAQYLTPVTIKGCTVRGWPQAQLIEMASANIPMRGINNDWGVALPSQTLSAATSIKLFAEWVPINFATNALTLTGKPVLPDGVEGQRVTLYNTGTNTGTIPHGATNNVRLAGGTGKDLGQYDNLTLVFDKFLGDWVQAAPVVAVA